MLKTGHLDLGIINLPFEDNQLSIKQTVTIQECFVAGEKYKTLARKKISVNELAQYPLLLLEKGTNTRKFFDDLMAKHGLEITPEIELGSIDILVQFLSG